MSTPANGTTPLCDLKKMGRELGIGLLDRGNSVYVWGVLIRLNGKLIPKILLIIRILNQIKIINQLKPI